MRVLLSTIGSRGEVQPMLALGLELERLGARARLCAPPDFRELIAGFGLEFVPVGPRVSQAGRGTPPTPEQRRAMIAGTVTDQFEAVGAAVADCAVLVGCGALQIAAHSIADAHGIPYIYVAYAANTLPSQHLPPPPLGPGVDATADNATQWKQDADRWNALWAGPLNARRAADGLPPVADVRDHIFTERPWLAADPTLGPWPEPGGGDVWQPGAWMLREPAPLDATLEDFLAAGEPPVNFGFGSMHMATETGRAALDAARALGRRSILLRGWSGLTVPEDAPDCLTIGDVDHQALFPRVAAVVHHGGAGTTTAVARAGVPQVVVPQRFDQFYWADRVSALGIGFAHAPGEVTAASLKTALTRVLTPETAARARELAPAIRTDGATRAAERIIALAR
ncbi:glycosyltransferase [Nocardia yunnanensis]|uniref:Glycosyltransferase n=1 Tax=Nocardia yunnanensis TaxID=2382165 RepID=A0A386ZFP8_9NOCA|nr:glycosyltransferase [Nocardia yunnanensis]AYF76267.1 glycosyltransferase [Nocardia yunnanensis]